MELIQRKDLLQLKQRIAGYFFLGPLSEKETQDYILFRLSVVQSKPLLQFSVEALSLIYRRTKGVPRLINFLCDYSLRQAFVAGVWTIQPALVQRAYEEIKGSVQWEAEERAEDRIEPKGPAFSFGKDPDIPSGKFPPFLAQRPPNPPVQEEPSFIIPEEEPFHFPEKTSKLKKFAVVLGVVLTVGGLGMLLYWEMPLNSWNNGIDLPAYKIKMPVTETERDFQLSQPLIGQKLSKIDPRINE
jgi:hypothetical protein